MDKNENIGVNVEDVDEIIKNLQKIRSEWSKILDVYVDKNDLNSIQPKSFSNILPTSIDEYVREISKSIDDWKKLKRKIEKEEL
ncbi:MAG: hypothetical protein ACOCP8_04530 [archaeon]